MIGDPAGGGRRRRSRRITCCTGCPTTTPTWVRRTRIEWYVRELPLIVVMPDGLRGFYTDNARGPAVTRSTSREEAGVVRRAELPARRVPARPRASAGSPWAATARCGCRSATPTASPAPTATPAPSCTATSPPRDPTARCRSDEFLRIFGPSPARHDARPAVPGGAGEAGGEAAEAADRLRDGGLPARRQPRRSTRSWSG